MEVMFNRLDAARASDLHTLECLCFQQPWTLKQIAGALAQPNYLAWGLSAQGSLLAYLTAFHAAGEMEIINLGAHPQHRRKGLGKRLLSRVLQEAAKMGIHKITLETRETNVPAKALYESMGFIPAGSRAAYYPDTKENALIYFLETAPDQTDESGFRCEV